MSTFLEANNLAVRSVCTNPLWTAQSGYTGAPATADAGVNVASSVAAAWLINMRPRTGVGAGFPTRRAKITVGVVDTSATYSIGVNGLTPVTYTATGGDTAVQILAGLAAAILADAPTAAVVTPTLTTPLLLTLEGVAEGDWTLAVSATGTTAALAAICDPTEATIRWWSYGVSGPTNNAQYPTGTHWALVSAMPGLTMDYRGGTDIVATNASKRLYMEAFNVTGAGDSAGARCAITYFLQAVIGPAQGV
jgi:hypothetical protein